MKRSRRLTAIIEREDDGFVALCPEMDVASQGNSIEEARANLTEALTLFFETADSSEIERFPLPLAFPPGGVRHPRRGPGWVNSGFFPVMRSAGFWNPRDSSLFAKAAATGSCRSELKTRPLPCRFRCIPLFGAAR